MTEWEHYNLWLVFHIAIFLKNDIFKSITFTFGFLCRWNHLSVICCWGLDGLSIKPTLTWKSKPCLSQLNCELRLVLWIWIDVPQFVLSEEIYSTNAECLSLESEALLIVQLSCCSVKGFPAERERETSGVM